MMDFKVVLPLALLVGFIEWIKGLFGFYTWEPKNRMTNTATKSIKTYPKDLKLKDGDICLENGDLALVSGEEAFKQHLQSFISITIGELCYAPDYGCEFVDSIFYARNKEFKRQCEHLARVIVENNTFREYIEEVYAISRKKEHWLYGKPILCVEFKVKGLPNTLAVKLLNVNDLLKKRQKRKKHEAKV